MAAVASSVQMPTVGTNGTTDPRQKHLRPFTNRTGPFAPADFEADDSHIEALKNLRVLVIGAGGLGCEILKNLALSGFKQIDVIDMDTIDVSNLNRQFLFRQSDVGSYKAEVAARFVMERVAGVNITPYCGKIQDKDEDYYLQFNLVICGLDSVEARRWINAMLVGMVDDENPDSLVPLIDGGTEGFKGQSKVILPTMTSCIECHLDMYVPRQAVPLCTLATIPRQPQHCIEWAHIIAWEQERKETSLDTDDPEHIQWLYQKAAQRAKEFNISGVTYSMTQGVVKNIIPAIASTNAIIAAACCNEAFKIATASAPFLGDPGPGNNNYMMYSGTEGIYAYTFPHEGKDDCPVCGNRAKEIDVQSGWTLEQFVQHLGERPEAQLKRPLIRTEQRTLYYSVPPDLEKQTRPNLKRKLNELLEEGEEVGVSDPAFTIDFRFKLHFT